MAEITENNKKILLEEIFNRTKKSNECWDWLGAKTRGNYGHKAIMRKNGKYKYFRIHRLVFFLIYGYEPKVVMHICDRPICCNPLHLKAGTMLDNVRDMDSKNRRNAVGPKGINCHLSKLNDSDVLEIIKKRKIGYKLKQLSDEYGIAMANISCICTGKSWNHITGLPKYKK